MIYQILISILLPILFVSCTPNNQMLINRNIKALNIGTNSTMVSLSKTDNEIDNIASKFSKMITTNNFKLSYQHNSFGLLPFTGHTVNISFRYNGNEHIYCTLVISKHYFSVSFNEIELKPKSNNFNTSEEDLKAIEKTLLKIKKYARKIYANHEIRITSYSFSSPSSVVTHSRLDTTKTSPHQLSQKKLF